MGFAGNTSARDTSVLADKTAAKAELPMITFSSARAHAFARGHITACSFNGAARELCVCPRLCCMCRVAAPFDVQVTTRSIPPDEEHYVRGETKARPTRATGARANPRVRGAFGAHVSSQTARLA